MASAVGSIGRCRRVEVAGHVDLRGKPEGNVITIEGGFLPGDALVGREIYVGPASQSAPWIERDEAIKAAAYWEDRARKAESGLAAIAAAVAGVKGVA